ncbi:hypothetical protein SLU01_04950 [Sporosarcina luteola]|uniref:Uncharacterized protein n=1 Tax=Sporosarcina luteola TaxID=582850 RepID=A0A511Z408_9BACL|nr:hypothetical protein [Sporosarcina luteola]GEN82183.1 hypothetical protein SLU01_04950 [Sporosarcina luteola]
MSKYISVFFLTLIASVVLYFVFGNLFDGGDYAEQAISPISQTGHFMEEIRDNSMI